MSFGERIRLAVTSDKMEKNIKVTKMGGPVTYTLKIKESSECIVVGDGKVEVAVTDNFPVGEVEAERIPKSEISKWCDDKKSSLENATIVLRKLKELLTSVKPRKLHVLLDVAERRIFDILSAPVYKDFGILTIKNRRLGKKTVDRIIELCEFKHVLLLIYLILPSNYYHEKALKCRNVYYGHAKWLRVTQLVTLRNIKTVNLNKTSLETRDIDFFLNFWVTVDYDMFQSIHIECRDEFSLHTVGVLEVVGFDEIEEIFRNQEGGQYYLIISKSTNSAKENQLGVIRKQDYSFHMKVGLIEEFEEFIDVLNLVHLRNEKKISLDNVDTDLQIRERDSQEWGLEELEPERQRLAMEIEELEQKLMNLNVQFDEGQPRLVREPAVVVE